MQTQAMNWINVGKSISLGLGVTAFSFALAPEANAFSISPNSNPNDLTNTIIGSGITISGTPTYTGASGAAGTFTDGLSSGIDIDEGIILTTGQANDATGPNTADNTTTSNAVPGDSDLNELIPQTTNDATVLEFDFETEGGDLFFNYVFASEEYNEYTGSSFNDVFAFFLDGDNIALIPGTNTPVSINTVNGGNPFGTNASNSGLFNNNDLDDEGGSFDIEYDGFTNVFTAQALGLTSGSHTIKLAVADAGDSAYDSAVFIQGNTFSDQPTPPSEAVPEPLTILGTLTAGGIGATLRRKFKRQ